MKAEVVLYRGGGGNTTLERNRYRVVFILVEKFLHRSLDTQISPPYRCNFVEDVERLGAKFTRGAVKGENKVSVIFVD